MNVLILYDQYSTHTNTVYEHLLAFSKHSAHTFAYCHGEGWNPRIQWRCFDAVIIHYSLRVAYNALPSRLMNQITQFSGVKFLFVQDEYDFTEITCQAIETLKIDVVYTCVPIKHLNSVYPVNRFSKIRFIETYTGFAPEEVDRSANPPISQRPIVVGYRGRALPYWYGDLGQEKQTIAEGVKSYCLAHEIACEIEWDDRHRIYGDQWLMFLRNCKATLGTESGANIFDYDGSIRRKFNEHLRLNPQTTYQDARLAVLGNFIEYPIMNQVSPRIFESIICGAALVLFEGEYSNVVKPYLHFIPLKKDFSNIDDVFRQLTDNAEIQAITDRAYRDVIESGQYSFATFIKNFDLVLKEEHAKKESSIATNLIYSWDVKSKPIRQSQPELPGWLKSLWQSVPFQFRQHLKPAARKAWDFVEKI